MAENDTQSPLLSPDYLSELIKAVTANAPERNAAPPPKTEEARPPLGDLLSALTSDPEIMSKLPGMIAAAKPIIEMLTASSGQGAQQKSSDGAASAIAPQGKLPPPKSHENDSRSALLCAMKPYLSADRRQAVDYIVRLGRLGDILKTL